MQRNTLKCSSGFWRVREISETVCKLNSNSLAIVLWISFVDNKG